MKPLRHALIALFLVWASASYAHANDFSIYGGIQNPGSLSLRTVTGAVTNGTPTFGTFGVRFSHGHVIGGEHTFGYSPNFISSGHSAIIYHSNFMVQAPLPIVRPYASAGLGTVYVRGSGLQAITGAKFAINYGGGAKVKLAGPVGAQFDARGYSIFSIDSQTMKVLEVSAGLVFSF